MKPGRRRNRHTDGRPEPSLEPWATLARRGSIADRAALAQSRRLDGHGHQVPALRFCQRFPRARGSSERSVHRSTAAVRVLSRLRQATTTLIWIDLSIGLFPRRWSRWLSLLGCIGWFGVPKSCLPTWGASTHERFHRTLLEEHLRIKGRTTWYETLEEMQNDLDGYLEPGSGIMMSHRSGALRLRSFFAGTP